jgi:Fic family protein
VYEGNDIPLRVQDSHDIRGTFQIVSNRKAMSIVPQTGDELVELLRARHAVVLGGRPEKNPGAFKTRKNRAGDTVFVAPEFVLGTLKQGFAMMASLDDPIARALYMMFLVSEVHPFDDGNGRIARIMMNAELVRGGSSKIIIPTVYRDDYMLALRRLTRQRDASVFVRMMERASAFSHWLKPVTWEGMHAQLKKANAYKESDQDGGVLRWAEE